VNVKLKVVSGIAAAVVLAGAAAYTMHKVYPPQPNFDAQWKAIDEELAKVEPSPELKKWLADRGVLWAADQNAPIVGKGE
jgi:hypothetical protein